MVPESWPTRTAIHRINSEPEDCNQKIVSLYTTSSVTKSILNMWSGYDNLTNYLGTNEIKLKKNITTKSL